ncbi:Wzz/FepE/Etk N-terminal domain-containing protein [Microbulbifer sp. MLAF003]|uniref:LPS O-antigen chain length determinant protein WzzB n=1 Tax=unclassified Microbulbifer TaxID=2619833 RepID=UPI0024AE5CAE|nr:Wzz/FepE/Etk N-terminal domain-containing protein [Microbulbifer sp. MLAF003]WHI52428.1 Wzz/FepE/Etk N-terminal domain-containing protein [Microbulbifer sp. MLAF003]
MSNANNLRGIPGGDEIDLIALVQGLWAQKWMIALVTLVVTLGAALYAFLSKPVYEARIGLLPPTLSDIADFNLARGSKSGLKPFTVNEIFSEFTSNLQSEKSRRQFFEEVYMPSLDSDQRLGSRDRLYEKFAEVLRVKPPTKRQPAYLIIVESHDAAESAEWARQYLDQVTRRTLANVLNHTQRESEVRIQQLQQELKTLREFAKIRKNDRLSKLREALAVASKVGLGSPPVLSGQAAEQLSAFMSGNLMYMRGTKAINAEIEALESRTSDDPFIPSLRFVEEQLSLLKGVQSISGKELAVSRPDGVVKVPDAPIKPRKALILALGIILGGMLGLFIALVRLMFSKEADAFHDFSSSAEPPMLRT